MIQRLKSFLWHKKGKDIYEENVSAVKKKTHQHPRVQEKKLHQSREKSDQEPKGQGQKAAHLFIQMKDVSDI
jgi:hypothetical protein